VKRKSFRAVIDEPYKLRLLNRESFDRFLGEFDVDTIIEIEVKEIVNRTQIQNSYYWGQVIGSPSKEGSLMSNEMFQGYTKQELHEALKEKFEVKSTSGMNQEEFTEYINKIIRWAAEFAGMYIKEPEDV
jgi:hypothetical protein